MLDDDIEDVLDFPEVDVVDVSEEFFSLKDIVAAIRKDSPGGKRMLGKLRRRSLNDDVEALLG